MSRGNAMEQEAIDCYSVMTGLTPIKVGFIFDEKSGAGCSPDAMVGEDGLAEIKDDAARLASGEGHREDRLAGTLRPVPGQPLDRTTHLDRPVPLLSGDAIPPQADHARRSIHQAGRGTRHHVSRGAEEARQGVQEEGR